MRRSLLLFSLLALTCTNTLGQGAPARTEELLTVIKAGLLIDGTSETPRRNQLIFVRGERIEQVADASATIPADAKVIDLSGATVLPGLIDAHTHIFLWGEDPAKGGYDANILKAGIALRAARATFAGRWSKALRRYATWRQRVRDTATSKSSRPSKKERFPGRGSL